MVFDKKLIITIIMQFIIAPLICLWVFRDSGIPKSQIILVVFITIIVIDIIDFFSFKKKNK